MDSTELHEFVAEYNWDDGLAPIWDVVESEQTEFATALMIYWLLTGPWLESNVREANAEAVRLQAIVRERLLTGFYSRGENRFDPELTRVQLYKFRKAGVPEILLRPSHDEPH